jgi:hypothetical protein
MRIVAAKATFARGISLPIRRRVAGNCRAHGELLWTDIDGDIGASVLSGGVFCFCPDTKANEAIYWRFLLNVTNSWLTCENSAPVGLSLFLPLTSCKFHFRYRFSCHMCCYPTLFETQTLHSSLPRCVDALRRCWISLLRMNMRAQSAVWTYYPIVRFEVYPAVTMKNRILWDVTPCGSCKNQRFGGT